MGCRTARWRRWCVCLDVAKVSVHCLGQRDREVWKVGDGEREEGGREDIGNGAERAVM